MGRAPCCDKVGLKKGPWTSEEDQILISFIQLHGHSNWRALPKQAGLLRCGKSCRLRWINYLRPDIKRGNFTKEEEDTIIQLHEMMGNRWSAIAARLPGRTDNEIKNVWHTHLKKRINQFEPKPKSKMTKNRSSEPNKVTSSNNSSTTTATTTTTTTSDYANTLPETSAPNSSSQQSFSSEDFSSLTEVSSSEHPSNIYNMPISIEDVQNIENFAIIDDTFWLAEDFTYEVDDISMNSLFPNMMVQDIENNQVVQQLETYDYQEENIITTTASTETSHNFSTMYSENGSLNHEDNTDFWLDVFVKAGGAPQLPEF